MVACPRRRRWGAAPSASWSTSATHGSVSLASSASPTLHTFKAATVHTRPTASLHPAVSPTSSALFPSPRDPRCPYDLLSPSPLPRRPHGSPNQSLLSLSLSLSSPLLSSLSLSPLNSTHKTSRSHPAPGMRRAGTVESIRARRGKRCCKNNANRARRTRPRSRASSRSWEQTTSTSCR